VNTALSDLLWDISARIRSAMLMDGYRLLDDCTTNPLPTGIPRHEKIMPQWSYCNLG